MKKILAFVLCLCTVFTLGCALAETPVQAEPEGVASLANESKKGVRVGGEDEGIHLLSAVAGK